MAASPQTEDELKDIAIFYQMINFSFGLITALLGFRFIFRLLGANPTAVIVDLLYSVSAVFLAPFQYIFPTPSIEGVVFEWSTLVAVLGYFFLGYLLKQLVTMVFTAKQ